MDGAMEVSFFDTWAWLVFVGIGLALIVLELLVGIDTGLDLVFIGTAFVLGGVITLSLQSWAWTAVACGIICVLYVFLGRRYIHKKTYVKETRTNIDTIIGKTGVVEEDIEPEKGGTVRVGYERWRARSGETLKAGEEITVTGVSGVTLDVKKVSREGKLR